MQSTNSVWITILGHMSRHFLYQSPFKASLVTRRPSFKCLSSMQVQLLSLWMGKHQNIQNWSPSLWLDFIFEITNENWQHKCCLFCSISVKKGYFMLMEIIKMYTEKSMSLTAQHLLSNKEMHIISWLTDLNPYRISDSSVNFKLVPFY